MFMYIFLTGLVALMLFGMYQVLDSRTVWGLTTFKKIINTILIIFPKKKIEEHYSLFIKNDIFLFSEEENYDED